MTFITHPDDATLQDLVDGTLPAAEATATRTHLEHCASCGARAAGLKALFAALTHAPAERVQAPADLFARIMADVDSEILPALAAKRAAARASAPRATLRQRFGVTAGALLGSAGFAGVGAALLWVGDGSLVPAGAGSGFAVALASVASHADTIGTVLRAGAPRFAGGAVASLAVLTPLFLKALQSIESKPQTVRVHAR